MVSAARRAASGMQLTLTVGMALQANGGHTSSYGLFWANLGLAHLAGSEKLNTNPGCVAIKCSCRPWKLQHASEQSGHADLSDVSVRRRIFR